MHMAKCNRSTQKSHHCTLPIMRQSGKMETWALHRSVALEVSVETGTEHRWFEGSENILCDTARCISSLHVGRNQDGMSYTRANTV